MSTFNQFCGIDVSKKDLYYCLIKNQANPIGNFEKTLNELGQIAQTFADSKFENTLFILEHIGSYSQRTLHDLSKLGRPISVVSPFQSKSYMSVRGISNKNDKQAAYCLALMGQQMDLKFYQVPSEQMQKRKQILSTLRALEKQ